MCCANVYNNLAHDPQAGTNTRSQPEFAPTRKQAARTYTRGLPSSFADLMSNLSQRVLSAANAGNPTSKSLSYKQYKYERSDSIGTDRYYRYIADCYPEANFNGSVSQEIYYQHTYFT